MDLAEKLKKAIYLDLGKVTGKIAQLSGEQLL